MDKLKSIPITKQQVWEAYLQVKQKGKAAGIDALDMSKFEKSKSNHLYRVWNRMASGSYFPPSTRRVPIPKQDGSKRLLGLPTIGDRVAQTVIKERLETDWDKIFHDDSYGYRPNKSAHQAIDKTQRRCWDNNWVVDLDIKGFFDNIDHELLLKAVNRHVEEKWIVMYIERWLKAPIEEKGRLTVPTKGSPQGGVISPLLSNLFLHYVFDAWMSRNFPDLCFVRYADDIIVHCRTLKQSAYVLDEIKERFKQCRLELHKEKTKIVNCKQEGRPSKFQTHSFTFLGFTFKPTLVRTRQGKLFVSFRANVSQGAKTRLNAKLRNLNLHRWSNRELVDIAKVINPTLRGWINYYGKNSLHQLSGIMLQINKRLLKWACNRYKRIGRNKKSTYKWLKEKYRDYNYLFEHWKLGFSP